ncbi:MAG: sulfur carrier protein ThiS [Prevotellaceae bacterium]|jgi:thiamine biosynthesis protein ThiS|nr:sulfur carrier protein ThiS [Prevotellaceae bacterium]
MGNMTILLNSKPYEAAEGTSLAAFVESLGLQPQGIAIAIGSEVIPRERWAETVLSDRLELMLIHAVSGG